MPWRKERLPTLVFLGFPPGSAGKESACNAGDLGLIPELGRAPGEGKGYALQYSGLENPKDCLVHGSQRDGRDWATITLTLAGMRVVMFIIAPTVLLGTHDWAGRGRCRLRIDRVSSLPPTREWERVRRSIPFKWKITNNYVPVGWTETCISDSLRINFSW